MAEALLLVNFLSAAFTAGMNMTEVFQRVSGLISQRKAEGKTFTVEDLKALFDQGDVLQAAALKQFNDTLADPNTPKV